MRRVAFIVNPKAGRGRCFNTLFPALRRMVLARDIEATVRTTTPEPDSARALASELVQRCDLVIACGGDGTAHGVLQALAGTETPMGILPLGTANALARNLGLPPDPVRALEVLLSYQPRHIPLGYAETSLGKRWFTVMAGAGPDGTLVREMKPLAKARWGRSFYYTEAARIFFSRRFPMFEVEYKPVRSSHWVRRRVIASMAARIPDLGGLFTGLTSASRLHHAHLDLHLLAAPAHLSLPAWLALSRLQLGHVNPWLTSVAVEEVRCSPLHPTRHVQAQVDAEIAGPLPLHLRLMPFALRLLMPPAVPDRSAQALNVVAL